MSKISETTYKKQPGISKISTASATDDILCHLAFDNSIQANIITSPGNGNIIMVNSAACKLLGYSKKTLLTKSRSDIFDIKEDSFKKMLKQRTAEGHSMGSVTAIQKSGKLLPCEITSTVFKDDDGFEKAIFTITDMSQSILKQKKIDTEKEKIVAGNIVLAISEQKEIDVKKEKIVADNILLVISEQKEIDIKKEKIVADNIVLAKSKQKGIDIKKEKITADNIDLAKSKQKGIDIKKEKIVADNIVLAKSKQKEIDIKKEKIVADNIDLAKSKQKGIDIKKEKITADNIDLAKSKQKGIDIKKEKIVADNIILAKSKQKGIDSKKEKVVADNIVLAKSKQKKIDTQKEKIVAGNIILALAKSDARQTENNQWAKSLRERNEAERSEIVRELHENVNQLLCASRMYLGMAKQGGENSEMYLSHSSEYTLTAIKEISKLTKGLTTDIIKNLGLCEAIESVARDAMKVNPVKIFCALESFIEDSVNDSLHLNIFRIVQEQLNNILKHAKATEVVINLSQNISSIIISIGDNGVGFDTGKKRKGIGVANIKSRVASYNGTVDFVSQPGHGCVLTVIFPFTDALLKATTAA